MGAWCHGIFEMFCMYKCSKDKKTERFSLDFDEDGNMKSESLGVSDNPVYVEAERPEFCKKKYDEDESDMTPCPRCWMDDCKFLATCPVEDKEAYIMVKAWEEASKQGEFDDLDSNTSTNGEDD